jgi:hypothetical protein
MSQFHRLYKHRPLASDTDRARVASIVLNSELYFAGPATFNDPFDCAVPYSEDALTDGELIENATQIALRKNPRMSPSAAFADAYAWVQDKQHGPRSPGFWTAASERLRVHMAENVGVLCLNASPKGLLLWSHYGGQHTGVCLEFDAQHPFFSAAHRVAYRPARPILSRINQSVEDQMEMSLFTKSACWRYEREWRRLAYKGMGSVRPGSNAFPPEALTGVILGARASRDSKAFIKDLLGRRSGKPVRLSQLRLDPRVFRLVATPL